jgi:hypothetical protein
VLLTVPAVVEVHKMHLLFCQKFTLLYWLLSETHILHQPIEITSFNVANSKQTGKKNSGGQQKLDSLAFQC